MTAAEDYDPAADGYLSWLYAIAVSEGEGNGVFDYWHEDGCLCFAPPPGFHATPAYANQTLARQGKARKANAIRLARGATAPRPPATKPGMRTCQRCRQPFKPPHKHIFRCRECKRATAWMG